MTDQELAEIEAREKAATPGPWELDPYELFVFDPSTRMVAEIRGYGAGLPQNANGRFIAHSREDIPRLIAALKKWKDTAYEVENELGECRKDIKDEIRQRVNAEAKLQQTEKEAKR